MQKGIDSYIKEQFGISEVDIRTYSPLTLAYIGDGIFDLVIRSVFVNLIDIAEVAVIGNISPQRKSTHTGGND